MRFLVDECTGTSVAHWLRGQNHEVFSVYEQARGMNDKDVLSKAFTENRILITNDKDFGEKVFRERQPHKGIILLRLDDERSANKVGVLQYLLEHHADQLENEFVIVTDATIRFARQI